MTKQELDVLVSKLKLRAERNSLVETDLLLQTIEALIEYQGIKHLELHHLLLD